MEKTASLFKNTKPPIPIFSATQDVLRDNSISDRLKADTVGALTSGGRNPVGVISNPEFTNNLLGRSFSAPGLVKTMLEYQLGANKASIYGAVLGMPRKEREKFRMFGGIGSVAKSLINSI